MEEFVYICKTPDDLQEIINLLNLGDADVILFEQQLGEQLFPLGVSTNGTEWYFTYEGGCQEMKIERY